jgi:rhodanese-related sulfurtransferase
MMIRVTTGKIFIILFVLLFSCTSSDKKNSEASKARITTLDARGFQSKIAEIPNAVIVDVRTPAELSEGMINGAINIDFKDPSFSDKISALDKDKSYFLYCLSGKRSSDAATQMDSLGFNNIYSLEGGLKNWNAEGLETVKP